MDSGLYAAYNGLLARTQALDTAANNLSNTNTVGFRAQRDYFRGVLAGMPPGDLESQVGDAVNSFGILGGNTLDLSQGEITATGNPLDLALDGSGFFAVQTTHGTRYTRDGGFLRAADGTLETRRGDGVLDATGKKIIVPSGEVQVGGDGTISVLTAEGSAIAGKLGILNFKGSDLSAEGANLFVAREGATPIASEARVQEGSLEGANQDAVHGTMQLLLMQRQAEMMQRAVNLFSNTLDKTAAEDLGKV
ncbi:flagellar hook-basal body protein [Terriglobus saanensis]|uniref:Flagellar basal-body rod protein FlgF n=1 Tax=Terriglobus saanensis (strain ATCC BAA-1853 / DSM 23119 / SP1PR4) TaxID=401053 RepID=E8V509_TERSS|nr:flagellar hook basal-body protein [Terriglobus saanensis]ADV82637.1 flagellar hook-basal body protein [Terriglobus saanensis SP1PR4]